MSLQNRGLNDISRNGEETINMSQAAIRERLTAMSRGHQPQSCCLHVSHQVCPFLDPFSYIYSKLASLLTALLLLYAVKSQKKKKTNNQFPDLFQQQSFLKISSTCNTLFTLTCKAADSAADLSRFSALVQIPVPPCGVLGNYRLMISSQHFSLVVNLISFVSRETSYFFEKQILFLMFN